MKINRWLATFIVLPLYACGVPVLAANTGDLLSGPVFSKLCESGVQLVKPGTWALNYAQLVASDDGFYFTQRHYGESVEWTVHYSSDGITEKTLVSTNFLIRDLAIVEDELWILFDDHLNVVDRHTGREVAQVKTTIEGLSEPRHERAYEMTVAGEKIYVAHGSLGLSVINIANKKLEKTFDLGLRTQKEGHWSRAVGVAQAAGNLYLTIDGVTLQTETSKPLNGLIIFPTSNPEAYQSLPINQKDSGLISMVMSSQVQGGSLVMNNWGLVQTVPLLSLQSAKQFNIKYKATRTNFEGKVYNTEMLGDLIFSGNKFYGCGKIAPDDVQSQLPIRKGVVYQGQL